MKARVEDYELNASHVNALRVIVRKKGECYGVDCDDCPFCRDNNIHKLSCTEISDSPRTVSSNLERLAKKMLASIELISSNEVYEDIVENYKMKFVAITYDPMNQESYYNFKVVGSSGFVIYKISDFENLRDSRFIKL